jgi:Uma2 family endonuclease
MGSTFELLALPAKIAPAARLSDDEFLAFCAANEPYRFEINEKGEILVMTPSGIKVGNLEGYVFRELDLWSERTGKGLTVNSSAGFRLPDSSLRLPDAGWISSERWNSLTPEQQEKLGQFCPDFVVEVRSPSDRAAAIERKMAKWMSNGARLAWLIDPIRKLAIVYRPGRAPETLLRPEFLEGDGPVEGFRLKMQRFWA